jgi:hypothetical protein
MNMLSKPNERIFCLKERPSDATMHQIYKMCDAQSVFAYLRTDVAGQSFSYYIVFRKWQSVKPEYQTWLELMLT